MQIYNTLSRKKEPLVPLENNHVRMYVCGSTVYDFCHLGHARCEVAFDIVNRYLREKGYKVTYVRNITDIDDKIIKRAAENGETVSELTERMIKAMHADYSALGVLPPDIEPRATDYVSEMQKLIQKLINKGYAYPAVNGDVYYRVKHFEGYGKLSGKIIEELECGARVESSEHKEDPLDFVLWKGAKPNEPSWSSPWGAGRPGWHIECSAMCMKNLGDSFDIHGGGPDLKFPHHENEIAQSEAATGKHFASLWMHAGALRLDNEKMSKSLGNFFTVREILEKYNAETVRYFLVSSHYRSHVNFCDAGLNEAQVRLERLYNSLKGIDIHHAEPAVDTGFDTAFYQAMDDDFNTPEALGIMFELARKLNSMRQQNSTETPALAALLVKMGRVLGILQSSPESWLQSDNVIDKQQIEALIKERKQAREERNFARADEIRQFLDENGIQLLDSAEGLTTWQVRRK